MKSNVLQSCALACFVAVASVGCSTTANDETPVGMIQAGTNTIEVHQEGAAVAPGVSSRFVMKTMSGDKPTLVTGWIGIASGEGSVKKDAVYDPNDLDFDDDVVSPTPIPAGAMFWVEVTTNGVKSTTSIAWTK